jgi:hypothetical protein
MPALLPPPDTAGNIPHIGGAPHQRYTTQLMDSLIHELTGATRTENDGELSRVGCYLFCSADIVVHGV